MGTDLSVSIRSVPTSDGLWASIRVCRGVGTLGRDGRRRNKDRRVPTEGWTDEGKGDSSGVDVGDGGTGATGTGVGEQVVEPADLGRGERITPTVGSPVTRHSSVGLAPTSPTQGLRDKHPRHTWRVWTKARRGSGCGTNSTSADRGRCWRIDQKAGNRRGQVTVRRSEGRRDGPRTSEVGGVAVRGRPG